LRTPRPNTIALDGQFWRRHALYPGLAFLLLAAAGAFTPLDVALERAWAFDATTRQFLGAGAGQWWARDVIHRGGGAAVRLLGLALVVLWLVSSRVAALRPWRHVLAYMVVAAATTM
jgi:hypothetical protein